MPVSYQGLTLTVRFLVSSGITNDIYLGWEDLRDFGVLPEDFPSRRVHVSAVNETLSEN